MSPGQPGSERAARDPELETGLLMGRGDSTSGSPCMQVPSPSSKVLIMVQILSLVTYLYLVGISDVGLKSKNLRENRKKMVQVS